MDLSTPTFSNKFERKALQEAQLSQREVR